VRQNSSAQRANIRCHGRLANRVFDSYEAIVDACCDAWNKLTAEPARIASIATRNWALQVKA
jgi:hypothetical protein